MAQWIEIRDDWKWLGAKDENRKRAVEGLSGMVVLGGAWESPDIFEALARSLSSGDSVTLRHISILRAQELLMNGNPSLGGLKPQTFTVILRENDGMGLGQKISQKNYIPLASLFSELRYEADNWNSARQWWMMTEMKEGKHPDITANFWQNYQENPPPSLQMSWFANPTMEAEERDALQKLALIILGVLSLILGIRLCVVNRRLRRLSI